MTPRRIRIADLAILLLLSVLLAACHDKPALPNQCDDKINAALIPCSTMEDISTDSCIIREAIVHYINGIELEKYVYFHDGNHYTEIDTYYYNQNDSAYADTPDELAQLTYDQGRIIEVNSTTKLHPNITVRFIYSYNDTQVRMQVLLITDGIGEMIQDDFAFYVSFPEDSVYHFVGQHSDIIDNQYLFEFKNGNRIRQAMPKAGGECARYAVRWHFDSKTYYDSLPNLFKDYAVRFPFSGANGGDGWRDQFWIQTNANNIVGLIGDDGTRYEYCMKILQNQSSHRLWIKEFDKKDSGFSVTYEYDCK